MKLFWLLIVIVSIIWYSTVTVLVAFKGAIDIREMLKRMTVTKDKDNADRKERSSK